MYQSSSNQRKTFQTLWCQMIQKFQDFTARTIDTGISQSRSQTQQETTAVNTYTPRCSHVWCLVSWWLHASSQMFDVSGVFTTFQAGLWRDDTPLEEASSAKPSSSHGCTFGITSNTNIKHGDKEHKLLTMTCWPRKYKTRSMRAWHVQNW